MKVHTLKALMASSSQHDQQWCSRSARPYYRNSSCLTGHQLGRLKRFLGAGKPPSRRKADLWTTVARSPPAHDLPEYKWASELKQSFPQDDRRLARYNRAEFISSMDSRFRPLGPPRGQWLGTEHILDLLTMLKNSRLKGVLPAYPNSVNPDRSRWRRTYLNLLDNNPNWRRYIVVLNTAPWGLTGHHWVLIYVDRTKQTPGLEYYDAITPGGPKRSSIIADLWTQFKEWNKLGAFSGDGSALPVHVNQSVHQRGGTECGMFVLWYALKRIQGRTHHWVDQPSRINDQQCSELRRQYFLHAPPALARRSSKSRRR